MRYVENDDESDDVDNIDDDNDDIDDIDDDIDGDDNDVGAFIFSPRHFVLSRWRGNRPVKYGVNGEIVIAGESQLPRFGCCGGERSHSGTKPGRFETFNH